MDSSIWITVIVVLGVIVSILIWKGMDIGKQAYKDDRDEQRRQEGAHKRS